MLSQQLFWIFYALSLLTIVVRGQADKIPDYKALAAQLDFNDPTVSIFEMRRILAMAMAQPIPSFVMDDSVRDFEPSEEYKYITVKDGRYIMQIYGGGEDSLREKELKILHEFRSWLTEKNLKLPAGFDQNLEELRVLACRGYDFKVSYDMIWSHDKDVRERVFPLLRDFESYLEYFEKGFYYGHGRDKGGKRPIMILNARKWIDSGVPLETLLSMVDIVTSYMVEVATIPGKIETWHTIIDVRDLSIWEMPIKSGGMIAMHLRETNFVRGATLHFTNVPRLAELATRFIYKFLDDFMSEKMIFWSDNYKPRFKELFGRDNLEKKFGGKLPNKKSDFWPPVLNTKAPKIHQATPETEENPQEATEKATIAAPSDEL